LFGSLVVLSVPAIRLIKTKILTLSLVVFISSILIIGTGLTAYAQQQLQQTQVFIVGSDGTTHEANLKATKEGGDDGQLRKISTFKIEAPNVVQINQGKDLIVFTTNPEQDQVQRVKVRNTQGQLTELEPVTGSPNTYSLAGYPVGVYVLDVIVQLSNNRQGAYETILVIIPPNQEPQPINFPVILQTIKTVIDTDIRIIDDDNGGSDDCPEGEELVDGECLPICPEGQERVDGQCVPICEEGEELVDGECLPICPEGQELVDGECVPICEEGEELVDGECVPICEEGQELVDGECVPICEEGQELVDGECVPICEEGQERVDGQCVPIPCPDGREPVDGVCPEPPDPCEENPDLPECQAPPESCPEGTTGTPPDCVPIPEPPGPCPEGEECPPPPPPPGPGLIPGPEPEPEPIEEEEESETPEDNGESGSGSEDGGDNDDNGDNGDGGNGGGGDSGEGAAE
jgi:hypothetical protein